MPSPAHPLPSDLSHRRGGALVGARKILSPVSVSQSVTQSVEKETRTNSTFPRACIAASRLPPLPRDVSGPFPSSNFARQTG